jgi:methionyl-tRNA formyltransferase
MKIIFMGTPDFSIPSLNALYSSKHLIAAVVTTPDKERGRGRNISFTPVKEFALKNGIPVFQPESLKDELFIKSLKEINADLFIVVAFRILPKEVYSLPAKGTFNLHGSILPRYRGAAPIQWSLINGDTETGVTTFFLEDKVDTGNVILTEKIPIVAEDNFGSLHDKMSLLGAETIMKTVELIEQNKFALQQQDNSLATKAPKITKETCLINWNNDAITIHNLIRGLSPYPGAFFMFNNKIIKIYKSSVNYNVSIEPGRFSQTKNSLTIGCGKNALNIFELQMEGKRVMKIDEFLRGYSFI